MSKPNHGGIMLTTRGSQTKAQVIDNILQINTSARSEWLGQFSADELAVYLEHLNITLEPRGSQSAWRRPGISFEESGLAAA